MFAFGCKQNLPYCQGVKYSSTHSTWSKRKHTLFLSLTCNAIMAASEWFIQWSVHSFDLGGQRLPSAEVINEWHVIIIM